MTSFKADTTSSGDDSSAMPNELQDVYVKNTFLSSGCESPPDMGSIRRASTAPSPRTRKLLQQQPREGNEELGADGMEMDEIMEGELPPIDWQEEDESEQIDLALLPPPPEVDDVCRFRTADDWEPPLESADQEWQAQEGTFNGFNCHYMPSGIDMRSSSFGMAAPSDMMGDEMGAPAWFQGGLAVLPIPVPVPVLPVLVPTPASMMGGAGYLSQASGGSSEHADGASSQYEGIGGGVAAAAASAASAFPVKGGGGSSAATALSAVPRVEEDADGLQRVFWNVDAKKLRQSDKQFISPTFNLVLGGQSDSPQSIPFTIMLFPATGGSSASGASSQTGGGVSTSRKGGGSFAKAKGRGHVRLKCLGNLDGLPADAACMRLRLAVAHPDSAFEKAMCNIVKHDFSENAVCTLRKAGVEEEWDLSAASGESQSFLVIVELAVAATPALRATSSNSGVAVDGSRKAKKEGI